MKACLQNILFKWISYIEIYLIQKGILNQIRKVRIAQYFYKYINCTIKSLRWWFLTLQIRRSGNEQWSVCDGGKLFYKCFCFRPLTMSPRPGTEKFSKALSKRFVEELSPPIIYWPYLEPLYTWLRQPFTGNKLRMVVIQTCLLLVAGLCA